MVYQLHVFLGLRIDTSGGGVNCSAPFKKGLMGGSPQGYYIVQSIREFIKTLSIDIIII